MEPPANQRGRRHAIVVSVNNGRNLTPFQRLKVDPPARAHGHAASSCVVLVGVLLAEQVGDGEDLFAVGAGAPEADAAHEGPAVRAPLLAEGGGAAGVALVDGDGFAGSSWWDAGGGLGGVFAAPVGGGVAGW